MVEAESVAFAEEEGGTTHQVSKYAGRSFVWNCVGNVVADRSTRGDSEKTMNHMPSRNSVAPLSFGQLCGFAGKPILQLLPNRV